MMNWHLGCWAAMALVASGCLVQDDDRCGTAERKYEFIFEGCVCAPGHVPNADGIGCEACGENEEVKGGACACVEGYARASASAVCESQLDAGGQLDAGSQADAGMPAPTGTRGQDMPCSSSSDCEGYDATFCMTLQAPNVCLVQGCARGDSRCAQGRECCEVTVLPQLAAAGGLCVPTGACTAPGVVVKP
jgi:hypothetical protein